MRTTLLASLVGCGLLFAAQAATADVVHLRDGRTIEGSVTADGNYVVVRHRFGEARVHQAEVLRIDETEDAWDTLGRMKAELGSGTADERYRFAAWARENGFEEEARLAFLAVLRVDLDHPGARAALGYVRHDGRWVTLADKNRLEGKVEYKGRWVTPKEKAELQAEAREKAEARRKEREAAKLAAKAAREARREAEREARQERLAAYQRELRRERARRRIAASDDPYRRGVIYGNGTYVMPYGTYGGIYSGGCLRPIYGPKGIAGWRTGSGQGSYRYRGHRTGISGHYDGGKWGIRWRVGF